MRKIEQKKLKPRLADDTTFFFLCVRLFLFAEKYENQPALAAQ
jgi:hypothetical protein